MIKRELINEIDKEYCDDKSVRLMPHYTDNCLIMDTDNILCLKEESIEKQPQIFEFEYDKLYLNVRNTVYGFTIRQNYFFKRGEKSFYLSKPLNLDSKHIIVNEVIMNRKSLENFFDLSNYDSIYILDINGIILYAKSRNDGIIINKKIIPSDEEIVEKERNHRHFKCQLVRSINGVNVPASIQTKSINQIKNFQIYGPILSTNTYSHILITSKKQKFTAKWFKIDFMQQNMFKMTTSEIPVIQPDIDRILKYFYPMEGVSESVLLGGQRITEKGKKLLF